MKDSFYFISFFFACADLRVAGERKISFILCIYRVECGHDIGEKEYVWKGIWEVTT